MAIRVEGKGNRGGGGDDDRFSMFSIGVKHRLFRDLGCSGREMDVKETEEVAMGWSLPPLMGRTAGIPRPARACQSTEVSR